MARPAFALPYTDEDLTGANEIVFTYAGGGNLTATVPLPVSGAGLSYGYYNYKTGSTSPTDSYTKAVETAMNTAIGTNEITIGENGGGSDMPGLLRIESTGALVIKWSHASSTLDPTTLGFEAGVDVSGALGVTADWPPGRLFLPPRSQWVLATPGKRIKLASTTVSGKSEVRQIATGAAQYRIRIPSLTPARVLLSAAAHADFYQAVANMAQSDPNTPFEALWAYLGTRAPLRYWPDRDTVGAYTDLDVVNMEQLQDLMAVVTDPHESGPNPLQDIDLRAQLYTS